MISINSASIMSIGNHVRRVLFQGPEPNNGDRLGILGNLSVGGGVHQRRGKRTKDPVSVLASIENEKHGLMSLFIEPPCPDATVSFASAVQNKPSRTHTCPKRQRIIRDSEARKAVAEKPTLAHASLSKKPDIGSIVSSTCGLMAQFPPDSAIKKSRKSKSIGSVLVSSEAYDIRPKRNVNLSTENMLSVSNSHERKPENKRKRPISKTDTFHKKSATISSTRDMEVGRCSMDSRLSTVNSLFTEIDIKEHNIISCDEQTNDSHHEVAVESIKYNKRTRSKSKSALIAPFTAFSNPVRAKRKVPARGICPKEPVDNVSNDKLISCDDQTDVVVGDGVNYDIAVNKATEPQNQVALIEIFPSLPVDVKFRNLAEEMAKTSVTNIPVAVDSEIKVNSFTSCNEQTTTSSVQKVSNIHNEKDMKRALRKDFLIESLPPSADQDSAKMKATKLSIDGNEHFRQINEPANFVCTEYKIQENYFISAHDGIKRSTPSLNPKDYDIGTKVFDEEEVSMPIPFHFLPWPIAKPTTRNETMSNKRVQKSAKSKIKLVKKREKSSIKCSTQRKFGREAHVRRSGRRSVITDRYSPTRKDIMKATMDLPVKNIPSQVVAQPTDPTCEKENIPANQLEMKQGIAILGEKQSTSTKPEFKTKKTIPTVKGKRGSSEKATVTIKNPPVVAEYKMNSTKKVLTNHEGPKESDTVVPFDPEIWSSDQVDALREAQSLADPTSSLFWSSVAAKVEGKTEAECKTHWFSLVKTPAPKKSRPNKIIGNQMLSRRLIVDDLFHATPMRARAGDEFGGDCYYASGNNLMVNFDIGSPIVDSKGTASEMITEYDNESTMRVLKRVGYKTYLQGLRRGVSKGERERIAERKKVARNKQGSSRSLSERVENEDFEMTCQLTPGGTVKVKTITEDDFFDEMDESDDDESDNVKE